MLDSEQFMESEDDAMEELYDAEEDGDADDDDQGDGLINARTPADDATEDGDEESASDGSDEDDEDDDEDDDEEEEEEEEEDEEPLLDFGLTDEGAPPASDPIPSRSPSAGPTKARSPPRKRSLSPAQIRRNGLAFNLAKSPRTYAVEAISALPHPVPIHALASSACLTHLLTGSDDGYIRNYDIFAAVNSKNFLTAPQRHHANVVEGLMKSGQLRCWWENPSLAEVAKGGASQPLDEDPGLVPVYSLAMHSDALWTLAGTDAGYINLFTVRHDPGKLCHVMNGHHGPVSALCLDYDEKGFFSAGWDGEAIQWDLNTGQIVRNFTAHGAQLAAVGLRPQSSGYVQSASGAFNRPTESLETRELEPGTIKMDNEPGNPPMATLTEEGNNGSQQMAVDSDSKSDASFDPLFDDMPEESAAPLPAPVESKLAMPGNSNAQPQTQPARAAKAIPPPKNAPPLLDPSTYSSYSSDLLMTASIDGQVILWDRRVQTSGTGVGRLWMSEKTPPWCLSACWSADGAQIYAGRRIGTVDVWDVRLLGRSGPANTPRLLKTLRNPASSGVVSCVVAFPDCRHIASASVDNIRLWNVAEVGDDTSAKPNKGSVQFKIIPGHHGAYISQMIVDHGARFLVSASSNRGWHGESTRTVFVHDIKYIY